MKVSLIALLFVRCRPSPSTYYHFFSYWEMSILSYIIQSVKLKRLKQNNSSHHDQSWCMFVKTGTWRLLKWSELGDKIIMNLVSYHNNHPNNKCLWLNEPVLLDSEWYRKQYAIKLKSFFLVLPNEQANLNDLLSFPLPACINFPSSVAAAN